MFNVTLSKEELKGLQHCDRSTLISVLEKQDKAVTEALKRANPDKIAYLQGISALTDDLLILLKAR